MPNDEALEGALALNLSLDGAQLSAQRKLVPKAVSSGLKDWLNSALKSGHVEDGNLYLYSSLSEEQPLAQLELYFNLDNVDLSYLSHTAQTLGGSLHESQIAFQQDERGSGFLWINSLAVGSAPEMFSYFQKTPLQTIVNNQLDDWQLTGTHETSLAFKIPLDTPIEEMAVEVKTNLNEAKLTMPGVGLSFPASGY